MGEIVFWTIIRIAIVIPVLWILGTYISHQLWWLVSTATIYAAILHPAVVHYRLFKSKNKDILESTLCSTCEHFDETAVLCMLHDKHPSKIFLPCEGLDWVPSSTNLEGKDIYKS
ncbi:MAG: hypothetical protein WCA84_01790 [Ignavibacteriaceae bacterium]|jgi:hypothetical protein